MYGVRIQGTDHCASPPCRDQGERKIHIACVPYLVKGADRCAGAKKRRKLEFSFETSLSSPYVRALRSSCEQTSLLLPGQGMCDEDALRRNGKPTACSGPRIVACSLGPTRSVVSSQTLVSASFTCAAISRMMFMRTCGKAIEQRAERRARPSSQLRSLDRACRNGVRGTFDRDDAAERLARSNETDDDLAR